MDQRGMTELLCSCLIRKGAVGAAPLPASLPAADGDRFLGLAEWHNIAPLLARRIIDGGCGFGVPGSILPKLADLRRFGAARNLCINRDLSPLLKALRDNMIQVIVLKGAHLAELVTSLPSYGRWATWIFWFPVKRWGEPQRSSGGSATRPSRGSRRTRQEPSCSTLPP